MLVVCGRGFNGLAVDAKYQPCRHADRACPDHLRALLQNEPTDPGGITLNITGAAMSLQPQRLLPRGAFCIGTASVAYADEAAAVSNASLGSSANIVNGTNIQAWTVSNLKQSTDAIPYPGPRHPVGSHRNG